MESSSSSSSSSPSDYDLPEKTPLSIDLTVGGSPCPEALLCKYSKGKKKKKRNREKRRGERWNGNGTEVGKEGEESEKE